MSLVAASVQAEEWIGLTAAARLLGVSRDTLERACERGQVTHRRLPFGPLKILASDVERLIAASTVRANVGEKN